MTIIVNGAARAVDFGGQVVTGIANVPHQAGKLFFLVTSPISGIVGTALSCLAGGNVNRFNATAKFTRNAAFILPVIYRTVVGCLNERARYHQDNFPDLGYCREKFNLLAKAIDYQDEVDHPTNGAPPPSFWTRHGATRGYFFIATVVAVISRVADLVLGSVGLIVSLACAGQWNGANEFTAKNLTILGIIDDLARGIRGMVNPRQTYLDLKQMPPPQPQPLQP